MTLFLLALNEPSRASELLRWKVRLALVDYRGRVADREESQTYKYQTYGWPWRWLRDLMDRVVSPFDPWSGYRRRPLRALLWKVSHPLVTMRLASLRWSLRLLRAIAPYTGPGKFGSNSASAALKAEWLLEHDEWAADTTGDALDWYRHVSLFCSIRVPWSIELEQWLMTLDSNGFVYVDNYATERAAGAAFDEEKAAYEQTMQPFDEDVWNDDNDPSEIVSVAGVHPRCDICGRAQQPEDDWNGETGNHRSCEEDYT